MNIDKNGRCSVDYFIIAPSGRTGQLADLCWSSRSIQDLFMAVVKEMTGEDLNIINSWIAIIIIIVSAIFLHYRILGEEKRLTQQYGDSFLEYKKKVSRYFLFI